MSRRQITVPDAQGIRYLLTVEESAEQITIVRYETTAQETAVIPAEIGGKPVTEIGTDCFFNHHELRRIILPEGLKKIGGGAFIQCKYLEELVIPDTVTEIGSYAFRDCKSLKKLLLPAGLEELSESVFAFSRLPEDLVLPEHLKTIRRHAFYSTFMTRVKVPDSVTLIEPGAFEYGPKAETKLPQDPRWYGLSE